MKAAIILISLFIVSLNSEAQKRSLDVLYDSNSVKNEGSFAFKHSSSNKTDFDNSFWINYGKALFDYEYNQGNELIFKSFSNYLFPDSTPFAKFNSDSVTTYYSHPWIHGIASVLDISSVDIRDPFSGKLFSKYNEFVIDSIGLNLVYQRNIPDTNIVDTLIFNIMTNDKSSGNLSNLVKDSLLVNTLNAPNTYISFMQMPIDTINIEFPRLYCRQNDMKIIKVPLTYKDSSKLDSNGKLQVKSFFCEVNKGVNTSNKGKVPGVFVTFKPGYQYSSHDTLDRMNFVKFFSQKETSMPNQAFYKNDLNCSYIYNKESKYIKNGNNWYGKNIPSMYFDTNYQYIYHDVFWKLYIFSGIDTYTHDQAGNSINSVYPNPTNGADMITVPFTLAKANTVAINLVDAQGL
ncbi:MAG: hypothetical protein HYZ42_13375, partial [Bacteroidetes bacterium]|nr:hypothetical protein [Bacteroidota bacterium]